MVTAAVVVTVVVVMATHPAHMHVCVCRALHFSSSPSASAASRARRSRRPGLSPPLAVEPHGVLASLLLIGFELRFALLRRCPPTARALSSPGEFARRASTWMLSLSYATAHL